MEERRLNGRLLLPYRDVTGLVFFGLSDLLDEQVPPARRAAALVRLLRYAGLEPGTRPIARLAEERLREKLGDTRLVGPPRAEVERDLGKQAALLDGLSELFGGSGLRGWQEPLATLRGQLEENARFVRAEVLPRARADFRMPPELYVRTLRQVGVDMPLDELQNRAKASFREIQNEMEALAPLVAREAGLEGSDYRTVLRQLKQRQVGGEAILAHYRARASDLARLADARDVVTLPAEPLRIRLATEAESALLPSPALSPAPMLGAAGAKDTFVLPLRNPGHGQLDDFTYEAAAWTMAAHEGRPGHELQYAAMRARGVSLARALFAFNSVNVEGWALYAEAEMKPYEPLEGQLASLQFRLLRAARAFLDPGLQLGTIDVDEARRVLEQDVVMSPAMATQDLERYTFRDPGQAVSYFCGYVRLMELRTDVERQLGPLFDRRRFHDFVLGQGLLPPSLLRKAVLESFVPAERALRAGKPTLRTGGRT